MLSMLKMNFLKHCYFYLFFENLSRNPPRPAHLSSRSKGQNWSNLSQDKLFWPEAVRLEPPSVSQMDNISIVASSGETGDFQEKGGLLN